MSEEMKKQKICNKCGEEKLFSYFHRDRRSPDGLLRICKNCHIQQNDEKRKERLKKASIRFDEEYYKKTQFELKKCKVCKKEKNKNEFGIDRLKKDGYMTSCKLCESKKHPEQYKKHKYKQRQSKRKLIDERIKKGCCIKCEEPKIENDKYYCEIHYISVMLNSSTKLGSIKWAEAFQKKLHKNPNCPYTGEKLILGINASLDHIKPKSRFPELKSDFDNLEWISWDANQSKRNMTKEEFLDFCKLISKYNQ